MVYLCNKNAIYRVFVVFSEAEEKLTKLSPLRQQAAAL
jgi:hypothetical protein